MFKQTKQVPIKIYIYDKYILENIVLKNIKSYI